MKKTFSVALSFILYLLIIFVCFLFVVKFTVLDVNFVRNQLIESKYAENLLQEIEPKLKSTTIASGFHDGAFENVLSSERVSKDMVFEVENLYTNTNQTKDFKDMNDELYKIAIDEVKKREIDLTDELDKGIKNFVNSYIKIYSNSIKLPFMAQAQNFISKATYFIDIAFIMGFILILIDIVILFILNRRLDMMILTYSIYSVIASIITLTFVGIFIKLNNQIENIAISSKSLYYFVVMGFNNFMNVFFQTNAVLVAIFIVLVILKTFISKNKKNI